MCNSGCYSVSYSSNPKNVSQCLGCWGVLQSSVFVRPTFQSLTKMTSWFLQKNMSAAFFLAPDFLFDILFCWECCFEYFKKTTCHQRDSQNRYSGVDAKQKNNKPPAGRTPNRSQWLKVLDIAKSPWRLFLRICDCWPWPGDSWM